MGSFFVFCTYASLPLLTSLSTPAILSLSAGIDRSDQTEEDHSACFDAPVQSP